jgi:hypothetical protein
MGIGKKNIVRRGNIVRVRKNTPVSFAYLIHLQIVDTMEMTGTLGMPHEREKLFRSDEFHRSTD